MTMQEAECYKAPRGWEADLRSLVWQERVIFFYVLTRGKKRRYVVEASA